MLAVEDEAQQSADLSEVSGPERPSVFDDLILAFREEEEPEPVLLLADRIVLAQLAAAWPRISVHRDPVREPAPSNPTASWEWLWNQVTYSSAALAAMSGLSEESVKRQMPTLIANRLVYPDGSLHSFARRLLRDRVLRLFETKSASRVGPTASAVVQGR